MHIGHACRSQTGQYSDDIEQGLENMWENFRISSRLCSFKLCKRMMEDAVSQAEIKICDFGSAMDASEQVKTACGTASLLTGHSRECKSQDLFSMIQRIS